MKGITETKKERKKRERDKKKDKLSDSHHRVPNRLKFFLFEKTTTTHHKKTLICQVPTYYMCVPYKLTIPLALKKNSLSLSAAAAKKSTKNRWRQLKMENCNWFLGWLAGWLLVPYHTTYNFLCQKIILIRRRGTHTHTHSYNFHCFKSMHVLCNKFNTQVFPIEMAWHTTYRGRALQLQHDNRKRRDVTLVPKHLKCDSNSDIQPLPLPARPFFATAKIFFLAILVHSMEIFYL